MKVISVVIGITFGFITFVGMSFLTNTSPIILRAPFLEPITLYDEQTQCVESGGSFGIRNRYDDFSWYTEEWPNGARYIVYCFTGGDSVDIPGVSGAYTEIKYVFEKYIYE